MNEIEQGLLDATMEFSDEIGGKPAGLFIPAKSSECGPSQVFPIDFTKHKFSDLQKLVGGYLEAVGLPGGNVLLVDEEGLLKHKPLNHIASSAAEQQIVGAAIFVPKKFKRKVL